MRIKNISILTFLLFYFIFPSCNKNGKSFSKIPISWKEIGWDKKDGIKILEGRNNTLP